MTTRGDRMLQVCAVDFTAVHLLAPLLRASRDDGWAVEFACADGPGAAILRAEGFRHRAIPMSRSRSPIAQLRALAVLATSLRRDRPDVVHTHTPAGGLVGRAAAVLAGVPHIVHTFHGLPFEGTPRGLTDRTFLAIERALSRRTELFFSQAAGDATRAVEAGIARAADLHVIGNGVDTRRFAPDPVARDTLRASLGIPPNSFVVTTVARLVREKGLIELADAAASLASNRSFHLILAGEALTSDRTSVAQELRSHRAARLLGGRWHLLGHRSDIAAILAASDVFTLPSYREGLPRSVIEAMAAGLPVVASDIPACRELVADGVTGILVPVRDAGAITSALKRLVGDPALRARMAAAGRALAIERNDERAVLERQIAAIRWMRP